MCVFSIAQKFFTFSGLSGFSGHGRRKWTSDKDFAGQNTLD